MSANSFLRPDAAFFARDTVSVARELLGLYLLTADGGGRIVETEAYRQDDPASHSYGGRRSARNASMFLPPGHLYVYRIHQVFCLNLTTEAAGRGCAVLIRALIPSEGLPRLLVRRPVPLKRLADGPGKLCQALGIDLGWDGEALGQRLWIEDRGEACDAIAVTPRIGISRGRELPWRFVCR